MTSDSHTDLQGIEDRLWAMDPTGRAEVPGTRPDRAGLTRAEDDLLAGLAMLVPPVDPPAGLFAAIEAGIDAPSPQTATLRADEGEWTQQADKVWKKILYSDSRTGKSMYLLRCAAGAVIPRHLHDHEEHAFMIEGEAWVGDLLVKAGDFHMAQAGSIHPETRSPSGCLVLVHL
jgi:anti-sigma factor ChrR (cupin superfamily)